MKKIICNVEYDTKTSELLRRKTFGEFGDPRGYEEALYITSDNKYFLFCTGGPDSLYPQERIKRMSANNAKTWLYYGVNI